MENQRVHEYGIETSAAGLPVARLGHVHNLITFISGGDQKVHYLDGKWVDDGQNPIDPETVPQTYKDQVAAIPFDGRTDRTPDVLVNCEFCQYTGPSREYASHLANTHVRGAKSAAATEAAVEDLEGVDRRLRPEELPPGNYVLDADGYVITNTDGSPRRKAGRPRKEED